MQMTNYILQRTFPLWTSVIFIHCISYAQQKDFRYVSRPWLPRVWVSAIPEGCPFKKSTEFSAIAFLGNHVAYTDADIWYPSWASDGNMKYSWAICGPLPGFRISKDYGKSWIPCPHTPDNPLFPESGKNGNLVKMGTLHFVDFGQNLDNSPDGYAYLVGHGGADDDPHPRLANNSWIAGDAVYPARVKPSAETINDLESYEFYAGKDQNSNSVWSHNFSHIKPVMEWMHHIGCTNITYDKPLYKYLMCVTDGWPGIENMNSYILESDNITGPFKLITYMKNFGTQGYFMTIPSKFIGADGNSFWLSYSANFSQDYFGDITRANPAGSRYAWNLQQVRLVDNKKEQAYLQAMKRGEPDPIKSPKNIALRANVVVSSALRSARPITELIQYFGQGAVDGVIDPESKTRLNEWVSDEEKNTAFIRLTWKEPQKISKVWLIDRPDLNDQIKSGMLVFSDGSTIMISALPNDGRAAKEIAFPEKKVTWLAFIVNTVSETTTHAGLAEIAVFK
jgi:hypothetical protein